MPNIFPRRALRSARRTGLNATPDFYHGLLVVAIAMAVTGLPRTPLLAAAAPTYYADVAPILYDNCVSCHRPGDIAPMPLLSYEDVRPWARSIKQKVVSKEMPPWFVGSAIGQFRNDSPSHR